MWRSRPRLWPVLQNEARYAAPRGHCPHSDESSGPAPCARSTDGRTEARVAQPSSAVVRVPQAKPDTPHRAG